MNPKKQEEWEKLREKLANLCHQQWSGWMKYLFSKCELDDDVATIPEWATERWQRQLMTPYSELSEEEKNSDRVEADKFIKLLKEEIDKAVSQARKEERKRMLKLECMKREKHDNPETYRIDEKIYYDSRNKLRNQLRLEIKHQLEEEK